MVYIIIAIIYYHVYDMYILLLQLYNMVVIIYYNVEEMQYQG